MLSRYLIPVCLVLSIVPAAAQWVFTYEKEDVVVDGATYRVNWQAKDGGIDFRTHRNESFYSSSPLDEKRRNLKAAEIVAKRVCSGAPKLSVDTKDGDMWLWRFECG
jgi:hypothetical protein